HVTGVQTCALPIYSHQEEKEDNIFPVTSSLIKDTTITQQYVSQIRSARHIEIRSQERGFLEKIYVDEGQFVHKGQPLFQIMPKIYQAEYLKAQAEVEASTRGKQCTSSSRQANHCTK